MSYKITLFLHIIGAFILFAAMVIEWLSLINFRKTTDFGTVKVSVSNYSKSVVIGPIAAILILIPGIYLMTFGWNNANWIIIAFIGMILLAVTGGVMTGKKMKAIKKIVSTENKMSPELRSLLNNNSLILSLKIRSSVFLGIIYLMTVKPDLAGSIITLIVSIILGFIPLKTKVDADEVLQAERKSN